MIRFCVMLAGITVDVSCQFESTRTFCRDYLTDGPCCFAVSVDAEDIARERTEGGWSDAYLETLVVYRQIAEQMVDHNVLLFHGSAVAVDGTAYLFTADSGTGKSTHARLWREVLPKDGHEVVMVNDDKPLLKFTKDGVFACGTPWDGKHHLSSNIEVPLKGICFLSRGETNLIYPVHGKDMLPELMKHSFHPTQATRLLKAVSLLDRLSRQVPLYALSCNMETDAARVSYEGMCGT